MGILEDKIKGPFLSLTTERTGKWYIAFCPQFEVSAWGSDEIKVKKDLYDLIKRNASFYMRKHKEGREKVPVHLLKYSEKVIENKEDISVLFKKLYNK